MKLHRATPRRFAGIAILVVGVLSTTTSCKVDQVPGRRCASLGEYAISTMTWPRGASPTKWLMQCRRYSGANRWIRLNDAQGRPIAFPQQPAPTTTPVPTTTTAATTTTTSTTTTTAAPLGMTIKFRSTDSNQYVFVCPNLSAVEVCANQQSKTTMTPDTATGALVSRDFSPLSSTFSVSIKATPSDTYDRFGPGLGITCTQRSGPAKVGTANGIPLTTSGMDWTGAGMANGKQYYHFWFTGCSLNPGVTHAEFYAEFPPLPS
jgi:hypothetical protein